MVAEELPSGCGVCGQKEGLLQCSSCKVMPYCSRDHQAYHRPAHKHACNAVKRARGRMETEEQILRDHPGDFMVPEDPFTNSVGHFWGLFDTRDYMRARFALVEAMTAIDNTQSVQAQLDHFMDMLRLCRSDNMGLRSLIPGLMLRLDKDQECYDFIKWWTVISDASHYDFGNTDLPYLDIKNADVFEGPEIFFDRFADLSHLICLCLLKIKLLFEIMRLEQAIAFLGPSFPREILDLILSSVPQIPAVRTSHDIMYGDGSAREAMLDMLKVQIDEIFDAVEKANEYFWLALIRDEYDFSQTPESYSAGSVEETVLNMRYNYAAWAETPGAIDFIKVKVNRVLFHLARV